MERVSIRQVARRAQVSHVTVANVLNGHTTRSSADTKARVLQAVQELGYVPVSPPATQSRKLQTHTVGVVFEGNGVPSDGFGLDTYQGLSEGAWEHGYDLLTLLRARPVWAGDREETRFLDRRCDGYIFVGPYRNLEVLEALRSCEVPVVACFNKDVPFGVASIYPDDAEAMRLAVDHLYSLGHRNIVHLAGPASHSDSHLRRQGFVKAMQRRGLAPQIIEPADGGWCGAAEFLELLALRPSAVVAVNDGQALELQHYLHLAGVDLPSAMAILGVDDTPGARESGLTSVAFSPVEVGRTAINVLCQLMTGQGLPEQHTVPVALVERNSTLHSRPSRELPGQN